MEPTHKTLVLSQSYEPVNIVSWKQAITLLFLGKAEVIEEYDRDIKTTSIVIKIPSVVRLLSAFRRHKKPVQVFPDQHLRSRQVPLPVLRYQARDW